MTGMLNLRKVRTTAKTNDTCFVAGTLVHTKEGLKPIERVKVGDWVLSQPEGKGELSFKQVTRTFVHESDDIWLVQFYNSVEKDGEKQYCSDWIAVTGGHPFFTKERGWVSVGELIGGGRHVEMVNGEYASASIAKIFQTETTNLGWAPLEPGGDKMFSSGRSVELGIDSLKIEHRISPPPKVAWDFEYKPMVRTVYNFEVEEFHTYYVGEAGVWVHNTNCSSDVRRMAVGDRAELRSACFVEGTPVLGDFKGGCRAIEFIEVGDKVLSRCETTGELAYKRVTKVFAHGFTEVYAITCHYGPGYRAKFGTLNAAILATPEHPFWVQGKGWTAVRDLQPGDEFLTEDGDPTTVKQVITEGIGESEVYNVEVEDFHTYFVDLAHIWVHNKNPEFGLALCST